MLPNRTGAAVPTMSVHGGGNGRLGVNFTERKLGLVFATISAAAGWDAISLRFCVCEFILVRGR